MMEGILNTLSSRCAQLAGDVLALLVKRVPGAREKVLNDTDLVVPSKVVEGLVEFIDHQTDGPGSRPTVIQNGINAVLVAALMSRDESDKSQSIAAYSRALGGRVSDTTIVRAFEHAQEMKTKNEPFSLIGKAQRSDCNFDEARKTVWNYCHSNFGSKVDTNSKRILSCTDLDDEIVKHPQRNWFEVGERHRYARFLKSEDYAEFQLSNPGKCICATIFRTHICKCVKDPTEHSCVDIPYSQIAHYQTALRNAIDNIDAVKDLVRDCQCQICEEAKANGVRPEDANGVHWCWKELLNCSAERLVSSICCPKKEHPDLRAGDDMPVPRLVPWACAKGTCSACGIGNKLNIARCSSLNKCDEVISVKEWDDAERNNGFQNEVTQNKLKVKEVLSKLLKALEDARLHMARDRFLSCVEKIDERLSDCRTLSLKADYSASPDLRASETDNCSSDNHAVLLVSCAFFPVTPHSVCDRTKILQSCADKR